MGEAFEVSRRAKLFPDPVRKVGARYNDSSRSGLTLNMVRGYDLGLGPINRFPMTGG